MRPVVNISGVRDNAFKLLMRTRTAMREQGLKQMVKVFDYDADAYTVLNTPSEQAHPLLYARVEKAALQYCDLMELGV